MAFFDRQAKIGVAALGMLSLPGLSFVNERDRLASESIPVGTHLPIKEEVTRLMRLTNFVGQGRIWGVPNESKTVSVVQGKDKTGTPIFEDSAFDICSISKQFTAVAILRLVEMGKLSLSSTLGEVLDNVPKDKQDITVEQLIKHTSGIILKIPDGVDPQIKEHMLPKILALNMVRTPGERFLYNNINYAILAAIIEQQSGKSFADFMQSEVFDRAEISATLCGTDQAQNKMGAIGLKDSYPRGEEWHCRPLGWTMKGMGGVLASCEDLERWHRAVIGSALLSEESQKEFWTPSVAGYGIGNFFSNLPDGRLVALHTGVNHWGYESVLAMTAGNSGGFAFLRTNGKERDDTDCLLFTRVGGYALIGERLPLNPVETVDEKLLGNYLSSEGAEISISVETPDQRDISVPETFEKTQLILSANKNSAICQSIIMPFPSEARHIADILSTRTLQLAQVLAENGATPKDIVFLVPVFEMKAREALAGASIIGVVSKSFPHSSGFTSTVQYHKGTGPAQFYSFDWGPQDNPDNYIIEAAAPTAKAHYLKRDFPSTNALASVRLFPTQSGNWYAMNGGTGLPELRVKFETRNGIPGIVISAGEFKIFAPKVFSASKSE